MTTYRGTQKFEPIKLYPGQMVFLIAPVATGKTTFCQRHFQKKGCQIISTDENYHEVLEDYQELIEEAKTLGKEALEALILEMDTEKELRLNQKIKASIQKNQLTIMDGVYIGITQKHIEELKKYGLGEVCPKSMIGIILMREAEWSMEKWAKREGKKRLTKEQIKWIEKQYETFYTNCLYSVYDKALDQIYFLKDDAIDQAQIDFIGFPK